MFFGVVHVLRRYIKANEVSQKSAVVGVEQGHLDIGTIVRKHSPSRAYVKVCI